MFTTRFRLFTRPVLMLTLLICVLSVTACENEACGLVDLVGPDEVSSNDTSSHAGGSTVLAVRISYAAIDDISLGPATVTARGISTTVAPDDFEYMQIPNVTKGESVVFTIRTQFSSTSRSCTWSGKVRLRTDPGLSLDAGTRQQSIPQTTLNAACVRW